MREGMDIRKKIRAALVLCLALLLLAVNSLAAGDEKFPQPQGAVNDFAGVIPPEYRESMTNLAQEVFQKTGIAIVVATFPTIGDHSPEDFVNRLYEAWGIGKKGEDKGVLIFVAVKERKFRIETGYGVEEVLPDGLVGEIRDRYAIPFLRKGDYGRGLFNTVSAISDILARHAGVSLGEQSRGVHPARTAPSFPKKFQNKGVDLDRDLHDPRRSSRDKARKIHPFLSSPDRRRRTRRRFRRFRRRRLRRFRRRLERRWRSGRGLLKSGFKVPI